VKNDAIMVVGGADSLTVSGGGKRGEEARWEEKESWHSTISSSLTPRPSQVSRRPRG